MDSRRWNHNLTPFFEKPLGVFFHFYAFVLVVRSSGKVLDLKKVVERKRETEIVPITVEHLILHIILWLFYPFMSFLMNYCESD